VAWGPCSREEGEGQRERKKREEGPGVSNCLLGRRGPTGLTTFWRSTGRALEGLEGKSSGVFEDGGVRRVTGKKQLVAWGDALPINVKREE